MNAEQQVNCEQGNISQKIEDLFNKCGERAQIAKAQGKFKKKVKNIGWLTISDDNGCWNVMYTNGKDTHQPLFGPILAADFLKTTGERKIGPKRLIGAWESALSLWPVRDEKRATQIFEKMKRYIKQAHGYNCG